MTSAQWRRRGDQATVCLFVCLGIIVLTTMLMAAGEAVGLLPAQVGVVPGAIILAGVGGVLVCALYMVCIVEPHYDRQRRQEEEQLLRDCYDITGIPWGDT